MLDFQSYYSLPFYPPGPVVFKASAANIFCSIDFNSFASGKNGTIILSQKQKITKKKPATYSGRFHHFL